MKKICAILAEGFEEVEALTVIDLLKRAGEDVIMVSLCEDLMVKGSHSIEVKADKLFKEIEFDKVDMIFLPGGMPGTTNLMEHEALREELIEFNRKNKNIAAICAAPMVLGRLGLLQGKSATCYPGFEKYLIGASFGCETVVVDENIITSRGVGTAIALGLKIIQVFEGEERAEKIADEIIYNY